MPAFQTPAVKRKLDYQEGDTSSKRIALDPSSSGNGQEEYWMVQWRNPQTKKHKTWDGDAILVANRLKATLYDIDGKEMVSGRIDWPLIEGKSFHFAGKDIELDCRTTRSEFLSGRAFGGSGPGPSASAFSGLSKSGPAKQFVAPKIKPSAKVNQVRVPETPVPRRSVDTPSTTTEDMQGVIEETHWTANWRKPQMKKHRTWDGDAYVSQVGGKLLMISEEGKLMGSAAWKGNVLTSGYTTFISGKEVQLDSQVKKSQLPTIAGTAKDFGVDSIGESKEPQELVVAQKAPPSVPLASTSTGISPASFYATPLKKNPKGPLHDPDAENAVVMKAPTPEHERRFNKKNLSIVPVVLDPILARKMRPHQIEGVKFMYESVLGMRKHEGQGCILADEMGLGKTLQTIALVWTLLRQNPYATSTSVLQKVLIVCPVSLVNNWKAEFHKWLGKDRVGVATCDKDKKAALLFMNAKNQQALIIGYERLRTVIDKLAAMIPPVGLIVCDEGHRLKSANNKTSQMFAALRTPRRIILSGTPIQNDLGEFHAMTDFCNPGLLDEYSTFRRVYELPILKSRSPDASPKELELGEARTAQLMSVAKSFVLRREATLLQHVLPPKHEYVVFVTPTALQLSIFSKILHPDKLDDLVQSSTAESLALINMLTKVSNSPILLKATADKAKENLKDNVRNTCINDVLTLLPERTQIDDVSLSGKLTALAKLLEMIRAMTDEKCVLVSHYTSTLNILEAFCRKKNYSYYRLDGQTPANKRQEFVTTFNKSSRRQSFIFLLSSKAGGVGINLVGASRLCLIDSDWNPSHDLQSMARCHRDGQTRPVYIYRFLTAGTIDEKIYQRQVTKLGLSSSLMGSSSGSSKSDSFSRKDLRDIFRVDPSTACNTHDLLECPCEATTTTMPPDPPSDDDDDDGEPQKGFMRAREIGPKAVDKMDRAYLRKKKEALAALGEWKHINCLRASARDDIQDDLLRKLIVVHKPEGRNEPESCPQSTSNPMLAAVDDLAACDRVLTINDLPGGSVSFLFQKTSSITLDESDELEYFT